MFKIIVNSGSESEPLLVVQYHSIFSELVLAGSSEAIAKAFIGVLTSYLLDWTTHIQSKRYTHPAMLFQSFNGHSFLVQFFNYPAF